MFQNIISCSKTLYVQLTRRDNRKAILKQLIKQEVEPLLYFSAKN